VGDTAFVTGKGKFLRVLKFPLQCLFVLLEKVDLRQGISLGSERAKVVGSGQF
jgi:hypothetical protein